MKKSFYVLLLVLSVIIVISAFCGCSGGSDASEVQDVSVAHLTGELPKSNSQQADAAGEDTLVTSPEIADDSNVCQYGCPKEDCPNTDCPKEECPKADCPKEECPKADCPKADCPKEECPKADCPKADCPMGSNYGKGNGNCKNFECNRNTCDYAASGECKNYCTE